MKTHQKSTPKTLKKSALAEARCIIYEKYAPGLSESHAQGGLAEIGAKVDLSMESKM